MKRSKVLSILLAVMIVLSSLSCLSVVSFAANLVDSGYTPDSADAENEEERVTAWEFYDDGVLYIYANPGDPAWAEYASQIKSVIVTKKDDTTPCAVTTIPDKAFYGYENLTTVDFSGGAAVLTVIGAHAFDSCVVLTDVALPNNVEVVDDYAFYGCTALKSAKLSASLNTIGKNVFKGCTSLETVNVPNGMTGIGYGMFEDCVALTTANLPDSIVDIGAHAFEGCGSLVAAVVPDSVTTIGEYAFYESGIKTAYIGHSVSKVGAYVFGRCSALAEVTFTSGIKTISDWMFYGCSALTTIVDFPESVEKIGAHAFENCSALAGIVVPNTVTEISESAFAGCSALTTVELSTALATIGSNAFNGTAIKVIEIPYGVANIGAGAFAGCSTLEAINVAAANTAYKSSDGVLYTSDLSSLIICPAGKTGDVIVADGTVEINAKAFLDCVGVTSVTIPASVTTIDATAFNGCSADLVIKTICNSYAAEYAKKFGIDTEITHTGETEWVVTVEPTCETAGAKEQKCADCDYLITTEIIDPLGHNYDNGVVTTEPTCDTEGVMTYTCQNDGCGNSYTKVIAALGHNYDNGTVVVEATCDTDGIKRFRCQNTGCVSYYDITLPATGHSIDNGTVKVAPKCDVDGTIEYKCTDEGCNYSYTDVIPATGHSLSTPVEALAPTCETDGYYTQECQNGCGLIVTTPIPATGHNYDDGSITKYPTVNEYGEITYTCENEWCTEDHANHTYIVYISNIAFDGILDTNEGAYADEDGNIQNLTWLITDTYDLYVFADGTTDEWIIYKPFIVTATFTGDATTVVNGSLAQAPELKETYILVSLGTVEAYAFQQCPKLEKVITGSITTVENFAFYDCNELEYVEIYGGLDKDNVGNNIFNGCEKLSTVILGNGSLELGYAMFKGCSALEEITLPESILVIGDSAFDGTALKTIRIPTDVEEIDKGAFTNCTALAEINVDNKNDYYFSVDGVLYSMELGSLLLCPAGKSGEVAVWEGTETIADDAFIGCVNVTKVIIPNSVTAIASNAFNNCAADLVIACNCDSVAYAFATGRGIATEITHVSSDMWVETTAPNCLADGVKERVCSGCEYVYETVAIPALGHDFDDGVITTKATCEADGVVTFTCTRTGCSESYTEVLPKTEHSWDDGVVIVEATCEAEGTKRFSCENEGCYDYYDIQIPALGHNYDAGTITTPATCETDGEIVFACTNEGCSDSYTEVISATGHNYVAVEVKKATCLEDGKIQHTCANCGDIYTEATKGEHVLYSTPVRVEPTCTEAGKEGIMCAVCHQFVGEVKELEATGHSYTNGTCSGCGDTTATQTPSTPGGTVVTPEGSTGSDDTTTKAPATPKLLLLKNRNEGLVLTWKEVEGATGYRVYRRASGAKSWKYLGTVKECTYLDKEAATGEYWRYTVRAVNDAGFSGFENGIYIKRVATPHMTSIANTATGVKIAWSAVSNAKTYKVYRRGAGETWKCIATVTGTSYVDTAIKSNSGSYYRYTVRAIDGYYSAYESGLLIKFVAAPHLTGVSNTSNGVKVNWDAVNGADSYRVYRREAGKSWTYVTTVTGTSYVDTAVKDASGYYRYTVRAVDGAYSGYEAGLVIKK